MQNEAYTTPILEIIPLPPRDILCTDGSGEQNPGAIETSDHNIEEQ